MKRATKAFVFAYYSIDISIHALVKRATKAKERKAIALAISIHALVKRATLRDRGLKLWRLFQSTPS